MGRENKKEAVAAFHKEQIMSVAEKLFLEKGYHQTTIDDISSESHYSRRTIYAYFESKETILLLIIKKGLHHLKDDIDTVVHSNHSFIERYRTICTTMCQTQRKYPYAITQINATKPSDLLLSRPNSLVQQILLLGSDINNLLSDFIEKGKAEGIVRKNVVALPTVYVLWSSITSLLTLFDTQGSFISKQLSISEDDFLNYGFNQIINSILEERI